MIKTASRILVLLSGGLNSTVCLAWAKKSNDEVHAVTCDLTGWTQPISIEYARQTAWLLGAETHEVIHFTDNILRNKSDADPPPLLHMLLVAVAANRARHLDINTIVLGTTLDHDLHAHHRQSSIESMERTVELALGNQFFTIQTPLYNLSHDAIIKLADRLGCYPMLAFSKTEHNFDNNRATWFLDAGVPDPAVVMAHMDSGIPLSQLPSNYGHPCLPDLITQIEALRNQLEKPDPPLSTTLQPLFNNWRPE